MSRSNYSDTLIIAANQDLKEKEYWWTQLAGMPVKTGITPDFALAPGSDRTTGTIEFRFSPQQYERLMKLRNNNDVKLNMILCAGITTLLAKYTGSFDIVIGMPIYKQEVESVFINTLVPLRSYLHAGITLRDLLQQIRQTIGSAVEHQNYPIQVLADQLNLSQSDGEFPLFDVIVLLENIQHRHYIGEITVGMVFSFLREEAHISGRLEYDTNRFLPHTAQRVIDHYLQLMENALANVDCPVLGIEIITPEEKQQVLEEFNNATTEFPADKTLHELFAQQAAGTPGNISVFGHSAAGEDRRGEYHRELSYSELDEKSSRLADRLKEKGVMTGDIVGLLVPPGIEMAIGIFGILKAGAAYLPMDTDYPEERVNYMLKDSGAKVLLSERDLNCQLSIANCQLPTSAPVGKEEKGTGKENPVGKEEKGTGKENIHPTHQNLAYVIYTSGTTGNPKGVLVEHSNVVAYLAAFLQEFRITEQDTAVNLTSIAFDAFVEELYPVLLRGGRIGIPSAHQGFDIEGLARFIEVHGVTIIDCTPMLLSRFNQMGVFKNLRLVISGGDVLKPGYVDNLVNTACVYNTYGPTETTVCAAYYRYTGNLDDSTAIPIGKPIANYKIHILDRYNALLPIGIPGELCIGGPGVTRGYLNQPGLTFEKFQNYKLQNTNYKQITNYNVQNYKQKINKKFLQSPGTVFTKRVPGRRRQKIYRTGDLARWLAGGDIEFLGRIDRQVKIRGYRIETGEIEHCLMCHALVKEAVVTARDDREGEKYLCAYIVPMEAGAFDQDSWQEKLREFLSRQLPGYMVPGYFVALEQIPLTPSGKIDTQALPAPGPTTGQQEYTPPGNPVEAKLVDIWADVLKLDKKIIGIDHNFFELGGHSLRATVLISKIHKELETKLSLVDLFKYPTIRELSQSIKQAGFNKYAGIEPIEKKEYYPMSSAQKRLYFLWQMDPGSTAYNMPLVFPLGEEIDKNRIEESLKSLIRRHESLRTSFHMIEGKPVQRVHDILHFEIVDYLATEDTERKNYKLQNTNYKQIPNYKSQITNKESMVCQGRGEVSSPIIDSFILPFDLSRAPLIRSCIFEQPDRHYTWMLDVHHIVSDGTSHTILGEDLAALYNEQSLPALRLQYKDFSEWQNQWFTGSEIQNQVDYWLELYKGEIPRLELPTDYKRPGVFTFAGDFIVFTPGREEAAKFRKLGTRYNGTLYMNILAVLNTLFYKYTGQADMIIGTGIAGRPHADLQPIMGMFVNTLAMRNFPAGEKSYATFFKEVINNSVTAFVNQDVQFEDLVDKLAPERDPSRNPLFDITMVVQNFTQAGQNPGTGVLTGKENQHIYTTAKFDLTFFVEEGAEDFTISIEYYTGIFAKETVQRMAGHFDKILETITHDPTIKLKDIDLLGPVEKNRLLYEFNDTHREYPEGKNLRQLFAQQAEKIPDYIAVVGTFEPGEFPGPVLVTYHELHRQSDRLAGYLINKKQLPSEARIGLMLDNSIHRIAAVLGILKAGGAYLPIDPGQPEERIRLMLDDAGVEIAISQKKYVRLLNRCQWECPGFHTYLCPDTGDIRDEEEQEKSGHMDQELWHHIGAQAVDDITGGGWFSSFTGEPFSREEMDEYGDNALKKLEPLLRPQTRVLEIGAASGITMFRIAPKVGFYYGTDLSEVIIAKNRAIVKEKGFNNIKLAALAGHEIHRLEENNFDIIIINSVIQAFPGHNYLRKVLRQCIDLLGTHGYLFIGDIMDLEKKNELVRESEAFKYAEANQGKNYTTKTDFSAELFVAREFWEDLGAEYPGIRDIRFSSKIYTIENELTRYRYDALITIDKKVPVPGICKWQKRKHQDDRRALDTNIAGEVGPFPTSLAYIMYTSGSTGKPKGVMVEHRNVARLVKNPNYIDFRPEDRLLLTGRIVFDITTFEIWAPLSNGFPLYLASEEVILDPGQLKGFLDRHRVSILHLIPQLFNQLFLQRPDIFGTLKYFLLGGDLVQPEYVNRLRNRFPRLNILHMYGPTENTTFSTFHPVTQPYERSIPIGKPVANSTVYILDNAGGLQPIGIPGELCLGGDGIVRGYLNQPGLTFEKFQNYKLQNTNYKQITNYNVQNYKQKTNQKLLQGVQGGGFLEKSPLAVGDKIYRTGDLARWLTGGDIEFLGRMDQQIKIRGIRIETGEIEAHLLKHPQVKETVVLAREDEKGEKYLCAFIASEKPGPGTGSLRDFLLHTLPGYMIPVFFINLESLPRAASGKVDRKALTRFRLPGGERGGEYTTPRDRLEEKLVETWSAVLNRAQEEIGIDTRFFQLGGHSLKATILAAQIHKNLQVKVPLAEIFKRQTVRELAEYIRDREKSQYTSIEPVEQREYYALSPAQRRFYFLQQMDVSSTAFNTPMVLPLGENCDKDKIEAVFRQLIRRHESLRTAFILVKDVPVQRVHDENYKLQITNYKQIPNPKSQTTKNDVPTGDAARRLYSNFKTSVEDTSLTLTLTLTLTQTQTRNPNTIIKDFIRPFDLSCAPLLRVGLVRLAHPPTAQGYLLMVDMHHIISDGTSLRILAEEFSKLYSGEVSDLEPQPVQYKDFSGWQNRLVTSGQGKEHEEFWLRELGKGAEGKSPLPLLEMPTDFPRPGTRNYEGSSVAFTLGKEIHRQVTGFIEGRGITLYMLLLTVYNILLYRYTGQEDIIIGSPIAGRHHADLQRIIGLVIGTIMMRNYPGPGKTFEHFLQEVKEKTLKAFEHQVYPFEELPEKVRFEEEPGRNPLSDVALIVHNMYEKEAGGNISEEEPGLGETSKLDFTLNAVETENDVLFKLEYCTALFKPRTMELFSRHFLNILKAGLKEPGVLLSAIDMITDEEKLETMGTVEKCYPLTHPQKRIYYTEKRYPGTSCNTLAFSVKYSEILDKALLEQAINKLVRENPGLRLRIVEFDRTREALQYIAPFKEFNLEDIDFTKTGLGITIEAWCEQETRKPFPLINRDLFYFAYLRFNWQESGYYMKFHHIAADGWTTNLITAGIDETYKKLKSGSPAGNETDTPGPSYLRYLFDETLYLTSPRAQVDRESWHRELLPLPEAINLWPAKTTAPDTGIEGQVLKREIPASLTAKIAAALDTYNTSAFKLLLSALAVYINRVTGNNDFVIGSANHNRNTPDHKKIMGMFVSTILFRITVVPPMSFREFVLEISEKTNRTIKNHQQYPYNVLAEEIKERTGFDPMYLLNINLVGHGYYENQGFQIDHHFPGEEPTPLTIHIHILGESHQKLELEWDYRCQWYTRAEILAFHQGLVDILTDALDHPGKKLQEIELLSLQEKERVLHDFNKPGADNPLKTVPEWFAGQVERTPDHVALVGPVGQVGQVGQVGLTYRQLNERSDRWAHLLIEKGVHPDTIVALMMERSVEMVAGIWGILKSGGAYLPIDPAYPKERIDYMLKDSGVPLLVTHNNIESIINRTNMSYRSYRTPAASLAYVIYTSGTTGKPKGAAVSHQNLSAYLNAFFNEFNLDTQDIVLQQASYSFDAFVEEMYPILLRGGRMAVPTREEIPDTRRLSRFIRRHQVTVITCSPPLLDELNRQDRHTLRSLRLFIGGGDVLRPGNIDNLLGIGTVYNTYGPTETTVCAAYFKCKPGIAPDLPIGKPISNYKIYILDRYNALLPIRIPGELCIGGPGVTRGYLNQPELTKERFIMPSATKNPFEKGFLDFPKLFINHHSPLTTHHSPLYKSGDLGQWLPDGNIAFLGRIDRQVKIRGYRIEPGEIENLLKKHPGIKNTVVLSKTEKPGDESLYAYIEFVPGEEPGVPQLKEYLSKRLPGYMIPSYFIPVQRIPLTPSGKVDKERLPGVGSTGKGYTAPRDEREKKLVAIWSEVLAREAMPASRLQAVLGIDDSFFDRGGHSLKATVLVSKIHKEMNIEVPLVEVFKRQTIRALAGYIKQAEEKKYTALESLEKKEYYPLSSAQKRVYFLQQMEEKSTAYNMPLVLGLGKDIDIEKLESALNKLIRRHESLRTSFHMIEGEPVQRIHFQEENYKFQITNYKQIPNPKSQIPNKESLVCQGRGEVSSPIIDSFILPFDLSRAPLIRSSLIGHPGGEYTWLLDMHHIISDGTSHTVSIEDFTALYHGEELELLRLQYKDFSGWQNRLLAEGKIKKQEEYWLALYPGEIPRVPMPTDFKRPGVFTFTGAHYYFKLTAGEAAKFKTLGTREGATLYMKILAVLDTLCYKYTGQTDIIIGTGIAGRPHADLLRIIGMFVNNLAMRNYPEAGKTYASFLKEVMTNSLSAFENQDVQFEDLVDKLDPERDPSRNPLFDISMAVQNFRQIGEGVPVQKEGLNQVEVLRYENTTAKFDLTFFVFESGDEVYFDLEYYTGIFKEETIRRMANHFKTIIQEVSDDPTVKLKDIGIISPGEKKQVLYEFNDTGKENPGNKTLYESYADQAEKSPDHIALVATQEIHEIPGSIFTAITYRELSRQTHRLANYLFYEKHLKPDEPVGILMTQPLLQAMGILGTLEAGGAYVPLDPVLPEERLKYMLNDTGARIVISEKRYPGILDRLQWECKGFTTYLCMDSDDIERENREERSELMDVELWDHVGEAAVDDITGGGWLSSYTGRPFSRAEMDEYGDNTLKKLEPLLHPHLRVLEIGCASGITMYRIAPKVGWYYGTDLSPVIIRKNETRVRQEGHRNIKLSCLAAHEIHRLEVGDFDLIILNSVIQCFPGHRYLKNVLGQCLDLLADKSYLFIGDIMDLDKKEALVQELTAFKYANPGKGNITKTDFSAELFVARGFWEDLAGQWDIIEDLRVGDKIHTIENELSKSRYDVLITISKKGLAGLATPTEEGQEPKAGRKKWRRQKYQEDRSGLSRFGEERLPVQAAPHHLAYIIYTSGTTGKPKGVEIEHRSAANTLCCRKTEYAMDSQDVAQQLFSYGFDGFVTGFFTPLISGARVVVLPGEDQGNVDKIKDAVVKNRVSHFICVPPLYYALLQAMTGEELSTLKAVTLAGDRIDVELLERSREKCPGLEIINEYGVTEAAVMSTIYRHQDRDHTIKIGKPTWNTCIYILNEEMQLQPPGIPGELCIAGVGLARGYLNNPELTIKKFCLKVNKKFLEVQEPFFKKVPGRRRLYKTGDLARWLSDGNIEFLGRVDHQVKIRGYRIELGEIEARLLALRSIAGAVVVRRGEGDSYLCAYVVTGGAAGGTGFDGAELKDYLARTLPAYMIPRYFVALEKFPVTPSGKIDRKKLPEPGYTPGDAYVAPGNETEEKLAAVWSKVLGIEKERIGVETGFFQLGGHSLSLVKMKARIKEVFNRDIPVARMFQLPTIRTLAGYIREETMNRQMAEEVLEESAAAAETTLRLFEELEDE